MWFYINFLVKWIRRRRGVMSGRFSDFYNALDTAISLSDVTDNNGYELKLLRKRMKIIERKHGELYGHKLYAVSKSEAENKVVTSVAIHRDNQKFIDELQAEAKEHFFNLTKEMIINTALNCLKDKYSSVSDVEELVDCFY